MDLVLYLLARYVDVLLVGVVLLGLLVGAMAHRVSYIRRTERDPGPLPAAIWLFASFGAGWILARMLERFVL